MPGIGDFTRDLLERSIEVGVGGFGGVVIEFGEVFGGAEGEGVAGDGVVDVGAEFEPVNYGAVVV